eukprot:s1023_g5.t1
MVTRRPATDLLALRRVSSAGAVTAVTAVAHPVLNEFSSPAAASGYIVPSRLLSASTIQEDKIPMPH